MGDVIYGEDEWAIAYHEAGHVVAAQICGIRWTSVVSVPHNTRSGILGATRHLPGAPSKDRAFVAWAGSWAQARYTGADLMSVQEEYGDADMDIVSHLGWDLADEDEWALALELHWPAIEALAERLVERGHIYADDDSERIERDLDELVYPAVEQGDELY